MKVDDGVFIEEYLKNALESLITFDLDLEIDRKVEEFRNQLIDRRDQYIVEIMKQIRILHSQNIKDNSMDYKIIFENITKSENEVENGNQNR